MFLLKNNKTYIIRFQLFYLLLLTSWHYTNLFDLLHVFINIMILDYVILFDSLFDEMHSRSHHFIRRSPIIKTYKSVNIFL